MRDELSTKRPVGTKRVVRLLTRYLTLVTSVEPDGGLIVESSSLTLPGDGGLISRAPYRVLPRTSLTLTLTLPGLARCGQAGKPPFNLKLTKTFIANFRRSIT